MNAVAGALRIVAGVLHLGNVVVAPTEDGEGADAGGSSSRKWWYVVVTVLPM